MMRLLFLPLFISVGCAVGFAQTVIRYNQMGYLPQSPKVLVVGSKEAGFRLKHYKVLEEVSGKTVLQQGRPTEKDFGAYGPFSHSYRISLSRITTPGIYRLVVNDSIRSGLIRIGNDVYRGSADFCLRYMRQQRSGFNPFLNDSCHTTDGYSMYGSAAGLADSTHIPASGGWHDASDYLQYATTSANAAYHLMMAWRDFPHAFTDRHQANGLQGGNGRADVLDEARWGLEWLVKMHPKANWMFAQLGDDRDHLYMRLPGLDSQYGKGTERPLYFVTGEPQGLGKYKNRTTGTSSVAAKFSSAFSLGAQLFRQADTGFSRTLRQKAKTARQYALQKPGFTNTAPNRAPYYYAEQNWADDMELMEASLMSSGSGRQAAAAQQAFEYARAEPVTPWLGRDTAEHYQWYPFINVGHRELARAVGRGEISDSLMAFYRTGIEKVWIKARQNAFYRGVPFIWCSNNLTVCFAIQCLWYRQLTGDRRFEELEQANIDWLLGTNPWGTSMVYGLPAWGDTPVDPHSAFTHQAHYPIDGGLVDGPVYTSIFNNLIGLTLVEHDEYADWQSNLAVYHDDYGDYSTNEPTMDGTASLIYLMAALEPGSPKKNNSAAVTQKAGAIIRFDSTQKKLSLVFTAHEFAEGGGAVLKTLNQYGLKGAFFLTGTAVKKYPDLVKKMVTEGHYVGAHSQEHLLYCDWTNRDSLLVTQQKFQQDILSNYQALAPFGINRYNAPFFLPPFEWYNSRIADWTSELGLTLINNTPGTLSAADYTTDADPRYRSSDAILASILKQAQKPGGLNGYILLTHIGAGEGRKDKFFNRLGEMIGQLQNNGYRIVPLMELGFR